MKNTTINENETASADSLDRLVQRVRSWIIDLTASLMNLANKIHYADPHHEIGWRDHLRWYLEGKLETVFGWAWDGSDEELEAVLRDEVPVKYMSARQLAYLDSLNKKLTGGADKH